MNREPYLLFILSLLGHLFLAHLNYEGLYHLPAVSFILMNYLVMILLRDWIIGFQLFFVDKKIEKQIKNPPRLFMFGAFSFGKDPYARFEERIREKVNSKTGLIKYLVFSLWMSFCFYFVVPKLGLGVNFALVLCFLVSWLLLSVYQVSHYILVIAVSFLIALLGFLKDGGGSIWVYLPYLLVLFANLSLYRNLLTNESRKQATPIAWSSLSGHLSRASHLLVLLVVVTFFMYNFLLHFKGQAQPKIDRWAEEVKQDVSRYAANKVEEYVRRKIEEKQNQEASSDGLAKKQSSSAATGPDAPLGPKDIEEKVEKLFKEKRKPKLDRLAKKIEEEKELFKKLDQEFRENQTKFKDIERRQAMQRLSHAQTELKKLRKSRIQPEELAHLKELLQAEDLDLSTEQIKNMLQDQVAQGDGGEMVPGDGGYEDLPEPLGADFKVAKKDLQDSTDWQEIAKMESSKPGAENSGPQKGEMADRTSKSVGRKPAQGSKQNPTGQQMVRSTDKPVAAATPKKQEAEVSSEDGWLSESKLEDIKLKIDQVLSHILGLLKILFLFGFLFLVYRYYQYLKPQSVDQEIKVRPGLDDDKKGLVKRKWSVLRQLQVPEDQEVLNTYRFFLETMAMADFPKDQWCPATEFRWKINQEFIGMDPMVAPITEYFCQSYYGGKTLSKKDLAVLRKARDHFYEKMVS